MLSDQERKDLARTLTGALADFTAIEAELVAQAREQHDEAELRADPDFMEALRES